MAITAWISVQGPVVGVAQASTMLLLPPPGEGGGTPDPAPTTLQIWPRGNK